MSMYLDVTRSVDITPESPFQRQAKLSCAQRYALSDVLSCIDIPHA